MTAVRLEITRLGQRGEGVASGPGGPAYVPYALPGEVVSAQLEGDVGEVVAWDTRRADRVDPVCGYFGLCGGCAVQALPDPDYAAWKRDLVVQALSKAGVTGPVDTLVAAHGEGRRRATFHARAERPTNVLRAAPARVGFMRARSHDLIDIEACPVLAPQMRGALEAAHAIANLLLPLGKPLDVLVTASETGLDCDLRGAGALDPSWLQRLADCAASLDLARLANHGTIVIERRTPILTIGRAPLVLPPGAFLQATSAGEAAMSERVLDAVGGGAVADLFCGIGTFALRLAERATVRALDSEPAAVAALSKAARAQPGLKIIEADARDLFRQPLRAADLARYSAVVFDPPRAGAFAQAQELAASSVPTVVAVSCNPATFVRDAATLIAGGYALERVTPIDQFLYSPHVEIVAVFRRPRAKRTPRKLFG